MAATPQDVQATFCTTLTDEWVRAGLVHAVVCPGSRSTPLALALVASELAVHVVLDERSAGFVAIGLARASGRATVVCVTSGTAAAELHAAVVEADLDGVPLIVCTADRPAELLQVGAPQTIVQRGLYGDALRFFAEPGVPDAAAALTWRSLGARLVLEAESGPLGCGPVHINCGFREPLVGATLSLPEGRLRGASWHAAAPAAIGAACDDGFVDRIIGRRGVLVAGAGCGDPAKILELSARLGWPVFADVRSGCRATDTDAVVVAHADALLRVGELVDRLVPDVVIHTGAPWASKVVGAWAATVGDSILLDPVGSWRDPHRRAAVVAPFGVGEVIAGLDRCAATEFARPDGWASHWAAAESAAGAAIAVRFAQQVGLDDPCVANTVLGCGGTGIQIMVSSSMPIRDAEWYGGLHHPARVVHANRGANGIDGVSSTAMGLALAGNPTLLLTGDLAFLHDASALLSASAVSAPTVIVVVDNNGGGIFEFLPQASILDRNTFEVMFGTPQTARVGDVAAGFGLPVEHVNRRLDLCAAIQRGLRSPGVRVVVVQTDRRASPAAHDELHLLVTHAVRGSMQLWTGTTELRPSPQP